MLWQRAPGVGVSEDWFSPAQYFDIREHVESFDVVALVYGRNPENRSTIIGVVDDVKHYGLDEASRLTVFYQHADSGRATLYGVVRATHDDDEPTALAQPLRDALRDLDPNLAVASVHPMMERLHGSLAQHRALMALLNIFGGVALTLATIGLYGVLSFTVATHRRELGVRKALGAKSRDLHRLVLEGAFALVGAGMVLGLGAGLAGARYLENLVFGVSVTDPLTFVSAGAMVLITSLVVSWLPAHRAAQVDPIVVLKEE